jgi:hypothetical protein
MLLVLIEKLLPWGVGASRFAGIVLAAWGIVALATGFYKGRFDSHRWGSDANERHRLIFARSCQV